MSENPAEDEYCDYCADHVPAHGYWRCPKCDAEWSDDEQTAPEPSSTPDKPTEN